MWRATLEGNNLETISLQKMRSIQLGLLSYIKEICVEHDLRYSLCGGTLIGAIRHKGYIPWDDDIDVLLPRPDYDVLLKILCKQRKYLLLSSECRDDYYYNFAKLVDKSTILIEIAEGFPKINDYGVYIDIYPIDGCPKYRWQQKIHVAMLSRYANMRYQCFIAGSQNSKRGIAMYFREKYHEYCLSKGWKYWHKKSLMLMLKYRFEDSEYAGYCLGVGKEKEILPKHKYLLFTTAQFEGESYSVLSDDAYLSSVYGNYMQLPPVEKQVSHHHYRAYKRESEQTGN